MTGRMSSDDRWPSKNALLLQLRYRTATRTAWRNANQIGSDCASDAAEDAAILVDVLDKLLPPVSAYCYTRRKRITAASVQKLFGDVVSAADSPLRRVVGIVREAVGDARCSAICFAYDRPVPFLDDRTLKDRVHGYLLLVERGEMLTLFRSGLEVTASFKREYLEGMERGKVERAIARHDAVFEKLSLRNMTVSPMALRAKTLEGRDVENAIAVLSAGCFVPQNYKVRRPDGSYSATPSTGRIGKVGERMTLRDAVGWAGAVMDLLDDEAAVSSAFIRGFARPQEFERLSSTLRPTYLAVDAIALADAVQGPERSARLVRKADADWTVLADAEAAIVLAALERPFEVVHVAQERRLVDAAGNAAGRLRFAARRISVQLDLSEIADVFVEDASVELGQDPQRRSLARYVDAEDLVVVLFEDATLAYIDGALLRDETLLDGGRSFLRFFRTDPLLDAVSSEKGGFVAGQTEFEPGSVFRAVVDSISQDDILFCDDLGDEWADFIGVTSVSDPQSINFYHAKHGDPSLSASAFHEAVGQAIKNLGRLGLSGDPMIQKRAGWSTLYRNEGVATDISRVVRSGPDPVLTAEVVERVATGPNTIRRVFIVTSSLRLTDMEAAFVALSDGRSVRPNFIQLYWLLKGFFSACAEVGVFGSVVCRP